MGISLSFVAFGFFAGFTGVEFSNLSLTILLIFLAALVFANSVEEE